MHLLILHTFERCSGQVRLPPDSLMSASQILRPLVIPPETLLSRYPAQLSAIKPKNFKRLRLVVYTPLSLSPCRHPYSLGFLIVNNHVDAICRKSEYSARGPLHFKCDICTMYPIWIMVNEKQLIAPIIWSNIRIEYPSIPPSLTQFCHHRSPKGGGR